MPLIFLSPSEEDRCKVPAVEGLVRYKNVTLGEPGVSSVTLIQGHDCVPRMVVHKVNPEVGPILSPTQAPYLEITR